MPSGKSIDRGEILKTKSPKIGKAAISELNQSFDTRLSPLHVKMSVRITTIF
jgi:hypothetical protein